MNKHLFSDFNRIISHFKNKRVAIVGSAPTCLDNPPGLIDSFEQVIRISNYGYGSQLGKRTDVFYSFFGSSTRKNHQELIRDGVKMCMSKLPNSKPFHSQWHANKNKNDGHDYRAHYRRREPWWFCPTYVPDDKHFLELFDFLDKHQPTTGFACIWDLLKCDPKELYITGFDFFTSRIHDVNKRWKFKNPTDPHRHLPQIEMKKLFEFKKKHQYIKLDKWLSSEYRKWQS